MNLFTIFIIFAVIVMGSGMLIYFYLNNNVVDSNVWIGMSCDEMLDWSGTDGHRNLSNNGHVKFHAYYGEQCNEAPIEMKMNMTGINMTGMNMTGGS